MKTTLYFLPIFFLMFTFMCISSQLVLANDFHHIPQVNEEDYAKTPAKKKKIQKKEEIEEKKEVEEKRLEVEQLNDDSSLVNYHRLRFAILPSYLSIEGTQNSNNSIGILNSKMYPALKLDYTHKSQHWLFNFLLGRRVITFENSEDRAVLTPTHTLYRVEMLAAYRFKHLSLGLGGGLEHKFFYKIINQSLAEAETRNDKKFFIYADHEFFQQSDYRTYLGLKFGMNPKEETNTYDIQTGYFYSVALKIDREVSLKKNISLELFYKVDDYKTQQVHFKSSEIGLGVSFSYDWGVGK